MESKLSGSQELWHPHLQLLVGSWLGLDPSIHTVFVCSQIQQSATGQVHGLQPSPAKLTDHLKWAPGVLAESVGLRVVLLFVVQ